MTTKYYASPEQSPELYGCGPFDTIEEAIAAAEVEWFHTAGPSHMHEPPDRSTLQSMLPAGLIVSVGEADPFIPSIRGTDIIESLIGQAHDHCGEASEQWENELAPNKDELNQLGDALTLVVQGWLRSIDAWPKICGVENVKTYKWDFINGWGVSK